MGTRRCLLRAEGSTSVLLMGVIIGFLAMTLVMVDMFNVYIGRRMGQKAADAAVLGAVQALGERFGRLVMDELHQALTALARRVSEAVDDAIEAGATPAQVDQVREDIIHGAVGNREMSSALIGSEASRWFDVVDDSERLRTLAIKEFLSPKELGKLACEAAEATAVGDRATYYATANGGEGLRSGPVLDETGRLRLAVRQKVPMVSIGRLLPESERTLQVSAAGSFSLPTGIAIDFQRCR